MATINAKDVAELRKQTGCGMMDCKNALVAANGDFEEAIKVLREKGMAATAKKASRIAADGLVDILTEGDVTAMVEVNSETDFVAKNETFRAFVREVMGRIPPARTRRRSSANQKRSSSESLAFAEARAAPKSDFSENPASDTKASSSIPSAVRLVSWVASSWMLSEKKVSISQTPT